MSLFFCSNPSSANFLTAEEKVIALERVRFGKAGAESWGFNKAQLIEALKDVRLYLFFLVMVCTGLPNGGVGAFGPTIIGTPLPTWSVDHLAWASLMCQLQF